MAPTARLRVTRTTRRFAPSSRPWDVELDGAIVGHLTPSEPFETAVEPGTHSLRLIAAMGLCSPAGSFEAREAQVVEFAGLPNSRTPIIFTRWIVFFLLSLAKHDLWIRLDYVDTTPALRESTVSGVRVTASRDADAAPRVLIDSTRDRPETSGDSALVVEHLTKHFGPRTAFSDVSFRVGYGEVFGFLGPNGAGKTTTVRTLATLIAPSAGSASVAGIPLAPDNGVEIRQSIAVMPEAPGLYLRLTVYENLEFFAGLFGLRRASERITQALEAVNLADRANDLCGGLSKGLRQRVGLARTLLSDPKIMFLDEPTSGLDPEASLDVHGLILGLRQRGVTIFLTTHRLDEAEKLCDRVAIMNTTLRTVGTPRELRDQLFHPTLAVRTRAPLGDPAAVFGGLAGVEEWHDQGSSGYLLSVSDVTVAAPNVARALVASGADLLSLCETQHSLEDIYLELVNQSSGVSPR